jgi:hypothetical protein
MNPGEVDIVIRRACGYWPSPRMRDPEREVWELELREIDFDKALMAIGRLARDPDSKRPTIRHLLADIVGPAPSTPQRIPDYWRIIRHDGYSMLLSAERCDACGADRPFPGTARCQRQNDCEYADAVYIPGDAANEGGTVLSDEVYERLGGPILTGEALPAKMDWLRSLVKDGPLSEGLEPVAKPRKVCPECGRTMIDASPLTICADCAKDPAF